MAKYNITKIECPRCHTQNSKRTWKEINVLTNPDLKKKVKNQSLFKFACKECGYEALLDYSLIYEDGQYRIYYVTTQDELDEVLDLLESKDELAQQDSKKNRIVCSQEDLIEKINIFDLGLDDKIIEVIKVLFYMNLQQQKEVNIDAILFSKETSYHLRFLNQGFEEGNVSFDDDLYNRVKEQYMDYMEEDARIDFDWATSVLTKGAMSA